MNGRASGRSGAAHRVDGSSPRRLVAAALALTACGGGGERRAASNADDNPIADVTTARRPPRPPTTIAATTTRPPTTIARHDDRAPAGARAAAGPERHEPLVEAGTIQIPKIGVDTKVYEGVTLGTLNAGPGHWPGSASPGQVGNVVIAGHRVSHHADFLDIDQLAPGDQVILSNIGGRYTYVVTGTEIVAPDQIRIIDQTPARTATLFACHPKHSTRQRIVVHLELSA